MGRRTMKVISETNEAHVVGGREGTFFGDIIPCQHEGIIMLGVTNFQSAEN